ncbi:MAG TPA: T9SS type A sorting domain-containing protein [Candidatus Kapabacteria bacterium]|nr:T9SS type A sorting domain-containing protein [Candidatus Kapabacteria bacterium]HPO61563.1 T9SS type A sorting domain-containing protein [Candidatus Kapabacteria bacterium]
MKNKIIPIIILIFLPFTLLSQEWLNNLNKGEERNLFKMQEAFYNYFKNFDTIPKGVGYKQFKRWEWFWSQRVDKSGNLPAPDALLKAYLEISRSTKTKDIMQDPMWESLGPNTSSGGYWGLGRVNTVVANPNNTNILWAGSAGGGLWKSTNRGETWFSDTDELLNLGVTDIAINPANTDIMYIATGDHVGWIGGYSIGLLKSVDGGITWNTTGLNFTQAEVVTISRILINPLSPNTLIVSTNNGIWRSIDAGNNWTQVQTDGSFIDLKFKPNDFSYVYAGTRNGAFYRSSNNGVDWTQITAGLPTENAGRVGIAVAPSQTNYVYVIFANNSGGSLGVYRSIDSGLNFELRSNSPNLLNSTFFGTGDSGQGWYDLCIAVEPDDAETVIVGGVNFWKSENGGANWSRITYWYSGTGTPGVHADQHYIFSISDTDTLYVGNDGGVYRTPNFGTDWEWIGNDMAITQFYRIGVSATNPELILAGAQDNSSWAVNDGNWVELETTGDGMEQLVNYEDSDILYTSSYNGNVARSTNGGNSFSDWLYSNKVGGESGDWITPYTQDPINPNIFYAGFQNVWKSTNSGSDWFAISNGFPGNTITILELCPTNPNYIYAGTGNWLRRTTDGGSNWNEINLPFYGNLSSVAIHQFDGNKIWITRSGFEPNSKVYYSNNGGASWTNISEQLPNMPVNYVLYQKNSPDRLYIATDLGIFYRDLTTDGWINYTYQLPNVVVSELEINYSVGKLFAATYGRGLWRGDWLNYLSTPILYSPENEEIDVPTNPELSWSDSEGAVSYNLQIATSPDFANLILEQTGIEEAFFNVSGLENNTVFYWRVKPCDISYCGNWSAPFSFTTTPVLWDTHNIALSTGWNYISTYINPENPDIEVLLSDIETDIRIMKNSYGQLYVPQYEINTIQNWNLKHGYLVSMNSDATLSIYGIVNNPEENPINLIQGWHLLSYLRNSPMNIVNALESITPSIVVVKNGAGGIYAPAWNINTIGNMLPGKAYYFFLSQADVLTYPSNSSQKSIFVENQNLMIEKVSSNFKNTGRSLVLILETPMLNDGTEINVFDEENKLVGVGFVQNSMVGIQVWGDDEYTELKDGAFDNESLKIKVKQKNSLIEMSAHNIENIIDKVSTAKLVYSNDGILFAKAMIDENATNLEIWNQPNPFSNITNIEFTIPNSGIAEIQLFSLQGEEVSKYTNYYENSGRHSFSFDSNNLPTGVYYLTLKFGTEQVINKMVIIH